jgi:pyruvate formate lyase activating enzyme
MKGCPLRCKWCHNPEGLLPAAQWIITPTGSRLAGEEYEAEALANLLRKNADVFVHTDGGVTFSGGEPLMQADFLSEVVRHLQGIHLLLDTSGYAGCEVFKDIVSKVQHVYYDLKLVDPEQHIRWTSKSNDIILHNLDTLDKMDVSYTIRVPLIPSITDTRRNLEQIAEVVHSLNRVQGLDLLTYNRLAGAKYSSVGMAYEIDVEPATKEQKIPMEIFSALKIPVRVLTITGKNEG